MENTRPKPGPHLSPVQPSLTELAERHARHASHILGRIEGGAIRDDESIDDLILFAEAHSVAARACAHAAIACRPLHSARVVKL